MANSISDFLVCALLEIESHGQKRMLGSLNTVVSV